MHLCAGRRQREGVIACGLSPAHDNYLARFRVAAKQTADFVEKPFAFELILPRKIRSVRLGAARQNHRPRMQLAAVMLHREPLPVPRDSRDLRPLDGQTEPFEVRAETLRESRTAEGSRQSRIVLDGVSVLDETAGKPRPVEKKRSEAEAVTLNRSRRAGGSRPDNDHLLPSHSPGIASVRLTMYAISLTKKSV